MGDPTKLSLGAGILKYALPGVAEPVDLVSPWPSGWVEPGYTHEGSDFSYEVTTEPVEVDGILTADPAAEEPATGSGADPDTRAAQIAAFVAEAGGELV